MTPSVLPVWVRWLWVAVYALILASHLRHTLTMSGQRRAWHTGHTLMALGMAYMFLPLRLNGLAVLVGQAVFAVAATAILIWIIRARRDRRAVDRLWGVLLIDMLAMIYMFALPGVRLEAFIYLLIAYFAWEAIAWLTGVFDGADGSRRGRLFDAIGCAPPDAQAFAERLAGTGSLELRVTLGAMAAGMAFMFLAMLGSV